MLLFLTTNMAAVTSRANQQLEEPIVTLATIGLHGRCGKACHAGVLRELVFRGMKYELP